MVKARCQVSQSREGLLSVEKKRKPGLSRTTDASASREKPQPARAAKPTLNEKLKL